jgi:hypothetical protein
MTLSQPTPTIDADLVREACAALLSTATRLLDRTHSVGMGSELGSPNDTAVHQPESVTYDFDFDGELSASLGLEGPHGETSTPFSSSTWHNKFDALSLDFGDWIDSDLGVSWQSEGRDESYNSHCDFGPSQSTVHCSLDTGGWSVQDNDKWPCFPG